METLNIAVLCEQYDDVQILKGYLDKYFLPRNVAYNYMVYPDVALFLDSYGTIYDIIFLDAKVRDMGGLETARRIREIDENAVIIFLGGLEGNIHGYEVSALDVLILGITYDKFVPVMDRAMAQVRKVDGCRILVGARDKMKVLNVNDIVYVEVFTHDVVYHLEDASYRSRNSLKNISGMLAKHHFVYAHRCYLVNLRFVKEVSGNTVICGKESIKIGGMYKKGLLDAVKEYFKGKV